MSEHIERFIALERRLHELRAGPGHDAAGEGALLDELDALWWRLTAKEQDTVAARRDRGPGRA